jgi:pseudaminic acid synthase
VSGTTQRIGPMIVAEVSANHNGSLERALEIVRQVAASGAHAVKLQTYTADTITLDVDTPAFRVSDGHELWGSRRLYDLYEEAHTPWEWHEPIFSLARELGLIAFSTPFDETAVDFLESLNAPIYKIASLEIIDLPLISKVAGTGKPMIVSVGTASVGEVSDAVGAARAGGCEDLTLLVATSSYPARSDDANLSRMAVMREMFDVKVGLSDHTEGTAVSVAAAALGARVIEKHVTLDREDGGVDSAFSLEPAELRALVRDCDMAARAIGSPSSWATEAESESLRLRPSLYVTEDVRPGDELSHANVRSVRPSGGLPPVELDHVLGSRFTRAATKGTPLSWDLIG